MESQQEACTSFSLITESLVFNLVANVFATEKKE